MFDNSCSRFQADFVAFLVGLGKQARDSCGHGLRVIVVDEDGMVADEFGNRAAAADDYRGCTAHGFGNDHAEGLGVTDLDIDFGALEPGDDVGILDAADEIDAGLNTEIGGESLQPGIGVAFVSDDDESLLGKRFENDRDGTKENFAALDAEDMVVEIEDGSDVRSGAVGWEESGGIDAIGNDNGSASAQGACVVKHEAGDHQDDSGEAETQARSELLVPGSRQIAGRNTRQRVAIEHGVVATGHDDDGLAGEAGLDERQNTAASPPGEVKITAPRDFGEGSGNDHVVPQVMKNANVLKRVLLFLELRPVFVGKETRFLGNGHGDGRRHS